MADSTAQASAEAALDAAVASRDMKQLELAIGGGEALGLTSSKNRRMQAASETLVSSTYPCVRDVGGVGSTRV